jgi:hypothetical protein
MREFSWAPKVMAALLEMNADNLGNRIAIADRALSDRLTSGDILDFEERFKIREARDALKDLKQEIH